MDEERLELVRVDATGTAHPVGKTASQRMRLRQGAFRLMPAPSHLIVMRHVGEDGRRAPEDGPIFRLAGEITTPGGICDIVALIGQAGWRGELVVLDGVSNRSIFFDRSHVVAATSTVEAERLGEILYRYGALSKEQIDAAARAVTADTRFGEAAVKLGFLTVEQLYQLMGRQTEEIAYAVLRVGDGMFFFLDALDESRIRARQNLSVSAMLMEGVRRMDEMRYFRDRIPSDQHVPARVGGGGGDGAPEEFEAVWEAIDGVRSIAEIGRVVGQSEFEVTQAIFQLLQSGHANVQAPRPTGPAAIVALFNQAITLIFQEVDAVSQGAVVREQLASFATGAGIYDALFRRAGPAEDGTVLPERITENVMTLVGPEQAESTLAQWLYEYLSFAVFIAEPLLRGAEGGPKSTTALDADPPKSLDDLSLDALDDAFTKPPPSLSVGLSKSAPQSSLARRVAELVLPLAPKA